jgi:hypothetical protein
VPLIKETIEGVEYGFAPLKFKELRQIRQMKQATDGFERLDEWTPFLKSSMERAGSQLPDLEEMDVDQFGRVFAALIGCVMKASGVEMKPVGEELPAVANLSSGASSTASSSPLPAGESTK